jgi:hypothetical protein
LTAREDQACLFLLRDLSQDTAEGNGVKASIGFDVDGSIGAHGESGAERLLNSRGADGYGDDFGLGAGFTEAKRLFNAVLVHGVHNKFAVLKCDGAVSYVNAFFRIKNLANVRQYPHYFPAPSFGLLFSDRRCAQPAGSSL